MGTRANRQYCSWCFKKTKHEKIQQNYVRRNVYQCSKCLERTLHCRVPGCDEMARGHDIYDDERCAYHSGLIESWGQRPPQPSRWCSWCFERTDHRLREDNSLPGRRNVYECTKCARRTLPCRSCSSAHTRGHPTYDDEKCAKCDGTIDSWSRGAEKLQQKVARKGWCSWCLENGPHLLEQKNSIRRDIYHCDFCLGRTLPYMSCDTGMTRGGPGWDDNRCGECSGDVDDWKKAHQHREEVLVKTPWSVDVAREQLERNSRFRSKALEAGMIRPFLYLVSMDPFMRQQTATQLGWSIFTQDYFGDPHAEAWDIINSNIKGIQARTNNAPETLIPIANNCNWYETLYRTGKKAFHEIDGFEKLSFSKSIAICKQSSDKTLSKFEDWHTLQIGRLQAAHMAKAGIAQVDELMESE